MKHLFKSLIAVTLFLSIQSFAYDGRNQVSDVNLFPTTSTLLSAGNYVDVNNSTTTPLGANATYTGSWVNTLNYSQIAVSILADQSGAGAVSLQIQFSNNGSSVTHTHPYAVVANVGKTVQVQPHGSYYRIVYTNGAVAQGTFTLQSILKPSASPGTILEASDVPTSSDDAALTKSIITGASVDGSGYKNVATSVDGGLMINQNTTVDALNSTTANLAAGASFVGASTSDLNYTAVQYTVKSDQNLLIYVDQSPDGINWDITDTFEFYTSEGGSGNTIQLVASYYRIRVLNISTSATTFLRLQTIAVPFLPSLPRALDLDGNLKVAVWEGITDESGFTSQNTPNGEIQVAPSYRIIGSTFAHSTLDTIFWTAVNGTGGSTSIVNAEAVIATGTTANNAVSLTSTKNARYISGSANKFHTEVRLPDSGTTANNTRRWGIYDANSGAWFADVNGTFQIGTRLGGVDTVIPNGSLNGELGTSIVLNANITEYDIIFTATKVWFYLGNKLLHTISTTTSNWTSAYGLPVKFENTNTGGSTTNVSIITRDAHVHRLGNPTTQPLSYFQQGLTAGITLKLGEGNLHGIVLSGITNNSVLTLYDNTTATGTVVWTSGPLISNGLPFFIDMKGIGFSTGLSIAITGAALNALIMYE